VNRLVYRLNLYSTNSSLRLSMISVSTLLPLQDLRAHVTVSLNSLNRNSPNDLILEVYYRVYAEDGLIPSANPAYSDDIYLGRILATRVSPPHAAINIMHCLSGVESIDEGVATTLFLTASSLSPMDNNDRVSILAYPGPGCTPDKPMVLVAKFSASEHSPRVVRKGALRKPPPSFDVQYSKPDNRRRITLD
jgi:hypothetical protein